MKTKPLPPVELLREIFRYDPDSGVVYWKKKPSPTGKGPYNVGDMVGTLTPTGYYKTCVFGRQIMLHRIVWALYHGDSEFHHIDHINGVKYDNRIANLREVTMSQNLQNQRLSRANTSGVKGVYFDKSRQKWAAFINTDKLHALGRFDTLEEAAVARRAAAEKAFGEFANKDHK